MTTLLLCGFQKAQQAMGTRRAFQHQLKEMLDNETPVKDVSVENFNFSQKSQKLTKIKCENVNQSITFLRIREIWCPIWEMGRLGLYLQDSCTRPLDNPGELA